MRIGRKPKIGNLSNGGTVNPFGCLGPSDDCSACTNEPKCSCGCDIDY